MKRQLLLSVVLAISGFAAHAASVTANSKVTDVTVYQDRALVTRSASVPLANGEQQVIFEGLPIGLDENSVRARGQGKGYKILGVEIRRDYKKVEENEQTKKLRDQIKTLQQKSQDLGDERRDLEQKRELLKRLGNNVGQGGDKTPPSVTDIKTFADYYGTQISAISVRLRGIERGQQDISEQIRDLSKQLQQIIQPGSDDKRVVVVTVNADSATNADLQVDYLIYGCSWQPQYDVHYQSGDKNIELTAYGVIRQNSGENWDGVKVTLSTARPQQGTSLPDLGAWTIDVLQPVQPIAMSAPAAVDAVAQSKMKRLETRSNSFAAGSAVGLAADASSSVQMLTANIETRGFSAVYKVPATVSVPSDGQPHRCTISIQQMSAEQSYASTPKLNPGAFVKAKVKNANAAPLLPGQLNIFMENDFVGSSQLALVGPEGVFDLFLGKDDSIKVQRKDKTRKEETGGIFTKSKTIKMGYTIDLENFQNKDVVVTLKDQIPVSQNDKIKVSYKSNAKVSEENKETGELTWQVTIPARKKITIDVDFQVECPPEINVSGI
jgi:uncharacterized protein (TIGR02231 family)